MRGRESQSSVRQGDEVSGGEDGKGETVGSRRHDGERRVGTLKREIRRIRSMEGRGHERHGGTRRV